MATRGIKRHISSSSDDTDKDIDAALSAAASQIESFLTAFAQSNATMSLRLRDPCAGAITGLQYCPLFVSALEERKILAFVDQSSWSTSLSRRVQHYGYTYNYRGGDVSSTAPPLPFWLVAISNRIRLVLPDFNPDQVIVNEYQPGQGIALHIDRPDSFGPTVVSLSLGSQVVMDLKEVMTETTTPILLANRSILVLEGDARYKFQHGIEKRKTDLWQSNRLTRLRRVSLTFRKVLKR